MEWNRRNVRMLLGVIAFGVLLFVGLQHLASIAIFLRIGLGWLMPFLLGACLAFIWSVPMRQLERLLFPTARCERRPWMKKLRRPLCLLLAIALISGILCVAIFLIVPEITRAVVMLIDGVPRLVDGMAVGLAELGEKYPKLEETFAQIRIDWQKLGQSLFAFLQRGVSGLVNSTFGLATSVFSGILQGFLLVVFAIYLLLQKERLGAQAKKVLIAYLPEKKVSRILEIGAMTDRVFTGFLTGQCLEALILGVMFFVAMSIFRFPYALMISALIGVTALVPMVGAFIGCFVGVFLILLVQPVRALWFIVLFLILQQVEGNLIYPHVVASSVGLPSIWVLVAVSIGGNLMGVAGMLLFIPLTSVVYALVREAVNQRYASIMVDASSDNPTKGHGHKM